MPEELPHTRDNSFEQYSCLTRVQLMLTSLERLFLRHR